MRFLLPRSSIPSSERWQDHSAVATKFSKFAARSRGQGLPPSWRQRAPSWTAASSPARGRFARRVLVVVAASAIATCVSIRETGGEPLSPGHPSSSVDDPLNGFIAEASERFGLPTAWIRAIVRHGRDGSARVARRKGAVGLMQLMPETWAELRPRYALGDDQFDPRDSILAGTAHLREMYDRYRLKEFFAAYYMGPTRYDEHLKSGLPLPADVQTFVAVLAPLIEPGLKDVVGSPDRANVASWRKSPLFVVRSKRSSSDNPSAASAPTERSTSSQSTTDRQAFAPHSNGLFVRRGMEAQSQ